MPVQRQARRQRSQRQPIAQHFAAQDAALGYLYQARHALLLLLKEGYADPEAALSIEHFDDIAFESNGSPTEIIQTKQHTKHKSSLSNSSPDLWKTVRIWSELYQHGQLDPSTTLLTLITTSVAPTNSIADHLRPAGTLQRDVEAALLELRTVAKSSASSSNRPAYDAFMSLTETQQRAILDAVQVLDYQPDIIDVREEVIRQLRYSTRPSSLEAVYERLEGWWFQTVILHLSAQSSEPIPHSALLAKLNDIQEQFQQDNLPIDYPEPLELNEAILSKTQRMFVEQLKLVNMSARRIQFAISDFYRAFHQRSRWMRDELLPHEDLEAYERLLVNEWERRFEIMKEDLGLNPAEEEKQTKGKSLFNWTDTADYPIRPRCRDQYIMRGSFHMLANRLRVGWHADFQDRLSKKPRKRAKEKTC